LKYLITLCYGESMPIVIAAASAGFAAVAAVLSVSPTGQPA
jgi:hypothetical protein